MERDIGTVISNQLLQSASGGQTAILVGISIVSLIANAVLSYFWLATRKWFRLYRADLHLMGNRNGVPRHLL